MAGEKSHYLVFPSHLALTTQNVQYDLSIKSVSKSSWNTRHGPSKSKKNELLDKTTKSLVEKYGEFTTALPGLDHEDTEDEFGILFEWTNKLDTENLGDYTIA